MRKSWGVIKTIINKKRSQSTQNQFKLSNGSITSDGAIISDKFNDFFYNNWSDT